MVLQIKDLTVTLPSGGDRPCAIEAVSLEIEAGKTLCVVGESGSGKSVMATAVIGLLPQNLVAKQGQILLQGESLLDAGEKRLRSLRGVLMGMVFQEPMTALNPVMKCGAQIDELLRAHTNWPQQRRQAEVLDILARVKLPDPKRMANSFPHQLSGGQRQRIVIAMAMILKPALLICDEPTTALDVTTQKEILRLIKQLQLEQGCSVLFITHDMGVVAEIADQVMVMHQGKMVEFGNKHQVLFQPAKAYTQKLLSSVPSMKPPPMSTEKKLGLPLLEASKLGKVYHNHDWLGRGQSTQALKNASLAVHAGETVGIVGESGSGKSTLARCLIRLIDPSFGSIRWEGTEIAGLTERALRPLRNRVQVVFQDPNRSLNPRLTVMQSMLEGAMNFGWNQTAAEALAVDLIQQVHLPVDSLHRYPSQFSGGQRQRIAIARALAYRPRVLLADEAVSALDVSVQAQILKLLQDLQNSLQLGMVFITHDLRVAAQLCDRVIVMHQGEIVEQGLTADLYRNPMHPYTQRLFESAPADLR